MTQTPQPIRGPVQLSNVRYLARLYWSPLAAWDAGAWLLDLLTASGEMVVPGTPVVLAGDLWACEKDDPRVPQGALAVVRVAGSGDPGTLDLGGAVELRYTD
jgi:hypothetical protein